MCVEDKGDRILGSSNGTRVNQNRGREDKRCFGLANSERSQRHIEILKIGELLLLIHQGLCSDSQTITQYGKEESEPEMDRKVGRGVQETEKEIYKKTSVSSTRPKQKIRMEVDVLDYAMKRVLSIEYEDKKWKLVDFLSKSLNETERNYETHDKEMLAVIRGLEN